MPLKSSTGDGKAVKAPYFSISVAVGALLCAAVFLSDSPVSFAQNTPAQKSVAPKVPAVATDSEKTLIDKTLGGAIAPQDDEGLEGLDNYSGSLSDRIANDHQPDVDNTATGNKPKRPKLGKRPRPMLSEPGRNIVKPFNPYAPTPVLRSNKVSFGTAPKITYIPGDGPPMPALTSDDIKRIARLASTHVNLNRLTPNMEEEYGLPSGTAAAYNRIRAPRVDGMLPTEFMVKSTIDSMMKLISQREGEARKKAAEAGYNRLSQMADTMRFMKSIPESTYAGLGMPDAYVEDEKEGYTVALDRLKEALEALDAIKKGE